MAKHKCECSDPGCPACKGTCTKAKRMTLRRIDFDDGQATVNFCDACGDDALESGVFAITHWSKGLRG